MCGIGGFVGTNSCEEELTDTIKKVCRALHHRGPDDKGHFVAPGVALGMTRLSIRHHGRARQPMMKEGVILVFNGEIYNTQELSVQLGLAENTIISDTELILAGYIRWGSQVFEKLSGMFAIAIWDSKAEALFLARDRWGEKPLYYISDSKGITFASDVAALKPWKHVHFEISIPDIHAFLAHSFVPTPHSGWKNIFKLKPGYYLKWKGGETVFRRYHYPQIESKSQDDKRLKSLLELSVSQCLVSDRPIGAFLSGGLDSSTVVTLIKRELQTFPVFSIEWDDPQYSESIYSSRLCKELDLEHHLVKCSPSFMMEYFDKIVALYGEPFGDESMIPTFCLAKRAKEEVDVVLTGDGADEFFHGYERYFFDQSISEYADVFSAMPYETRKFVCHQDFIQIKPTMKLSFKKEWGIEKVGEMRSRSFDDIQNYLVDDILVKVDRATMGVGLEARAPFLTADLTDFALKCSLNSLISRGNRGKWILRKAVKGDLSPVIRNRKKQGFGVPLGSWFLTELKSWAKERLLGGALSDTGWFLQSGIKQLCSDPMRYSRPLFNLLVLESWLRQSNN